MSQTPPNPGWQGGPPGPGQPWNTGAPQGQPGYQPQGGPGQGFSAPNAPQGGYPGAPQGGYPHQGFAPGSPQQNFGGPQQGYGQAFPGDAPAKPKSRAKLIIAGVLGLAVVAAGVGVALFLFRGATPAAAQGLPANVSFAAELNLAPASADQLALKNIIGKYPSLQAEADFGTDYKAALWGLVTRDIPDAPDYETQIKPWLGDSIAIGSLGTTEEEFGDEDNIVVAVETTDRNKARAFAEAEMDGARVDFIDDLMIVTGENSTLTVDEISKDSLADSEQYKADMSRLGTGSLATIWFGSGMLDTALAELNEQGLDTPAVDTATLKGTHGVVGLKVADDKLTFDLRIQTPNAAETTDLPDVSALAGGLPGDSLIAIASGTSTDLSQAWDLLAQQPDMIETLQQLGIGSAADLSALIGTRMSLAFDWDEAGDMPIIGATFESHDQARQKEILDHLNDMLAQLGGLEGLTLTQQDGTGVIAFGQSTDEVLTPASRLGDVAGFKEVVGGKAQSVIFINVESLKERSFYQQIVPGEPEFAEALAPVTAIGMTSNATGEHYTEAQFHVTFK